MLPPLDLYLGVFSIISSFYPNCDVDKLILLEKTYIHLFVAATKQIEESESKLDQSSKLK